MFLCHRDQSYFYKSTLKTLMQQLEPDDFIRVNKSHIVAIDKTKKLKRNYRLETVLFQAFEEPYTNQAQKLKVLDEPD